MPREMHSNLGFEGLGVAPSVRKTYMMICNVEAMNAFCISTAYVLVSDMKAFLIDSRAQG